tara:strand:- start:5252 stop:5503 length:252 start_codon:yes stop_codon:yes gene_type:complete
VAQATWVPDPRVAALDAIVAGLEKDNGELRGITRARDQRIEALETELARMQWASMVQPAPAEPVKTKTKKKSARKCPPLKAKE